MTNLFVTSEELEEFTGCKTDGAQRFVLKKRRIKHFVNLKGVVLTRAEWQRTEKGNRPDKIIPTRQEIDRLQSMPRVWSGIYFLLQDGEIVYIGKTTNFFGRIARHHGGGYIFDSIKFLPIPVQNLDVIEREYIARLCPKLNKMHNKFIAIESFAAPTTGEPNA